MTREEAIKIIKTEQRCVYRQGGKGCDRVCNACDLVLKDIDILEAYDMAIKALEQEHCDMKQGVEKEYLYESLCEDLKKANAEIERLSKPCEDTVSRTRAIEFVNEAIGGKNDFAEAIREGVDSVLSALPPVTPTQKWTPCSERMPEESITVIGTTKFDDIYKTELYDDCGEKKWYANGSFDVPIVAWMPLPQPYSEVEE